MTEELHEWPTSCPTCGNALWQDGASDAPYCLDCPGHLPWPERCRQAERSLAAYQLNQAGHELDCAGLTARIKQLEAELERERKYRQFLVLAVLRANSATNIFSSP